MDGGGSEVALDVTIPTGNPSISGSIDRVQGSITVGGAWSGLSAHDAQMEIYKNATCMGQAAHVEHLSWNVLDSASSTFREGVADWLTRGTNYCAKIRLGEAVAQLDLGTLNFAEFTSVGLIADDLNALNLAASFQMNHAVSVTQTLYENSDAVGGDCVGGRSWDLRMWRQRKTRPISGPVDIYAIEAWCFVLCSICCE